MASVSCSGGYQATSNATAWSWPGLSATSTVVASSLSSVQFATVSTTSEPPAILSPVQQSTHIATTSEPPAILSPVKQSTQVFTTTTLEPPAILSPVQQSTHVATTSEPPAILSPVQSSPSHSSPAPAPAVVTSPSPAPSSPAPVPASPSQFTLRTSSITPHSLLADCTAGSVPPVGTNQPSGPAQTLKTVAVTSSPAAPSGAIAIGSQTLVPGGPAITVSGTPISLGAAATNVVVVSSTLGLGPAIVSGLGGTPIVSSTTGAPGSQYTGPAAIGAAGRNVLPGLAPVLAALFWCCVF